MQGQFKVKDDYSNLVCGRRFDSGVAKRIEIVEHRRQVEVIERSPSIE